MMSPTTSMPSVVRASPSSPTRRPPDRCRARSHRGRGPRAPPRDWARSGPTATGMSPPGDQAVAEGRDRDRAAQRLDQHEAGGAVEARRAVADRAGGARRGAGLVAAVEAVDAVQRVAAAALVEAEAGHRRAAQAGLLEGRAVAAEGRHGRLVPCLPGVRSGSCPGAPLSCCRRDALSSASRSPGDCRRPPGCRDRGRWLRPG